MQLHGLDIGIIVGYFVAVITIGLWVSRKGTKDLDSYFLGGKTLPWYMLGRLGRLRDVRHQRHDAARLLAVPLRREEHLAPVGLAHVQPDLPDDVHERWLRRSNVLTGAQWMQTRFGNDRGATLAHLSVVAFALINVIGLLAYAFKGIGKFASGSCRGTSPAPRPASSPTTTSTRWSSWG
jgi:solute:Na+ symporter, SSS family